MAKACRVNVGGGTNVLLESRSEAGDCSRCPPAVSLTGIALWTRVPPAGFEPAADGRKSSMFAVTPWRRWHAGIWTPTFALQERRAARLHHEPMSTSGAGVGPARPRGASGLAPRCVAVPPAGPREGPGARRTPRSGLGGIVLR